MSAHNETELAAVASTDLAVLPPSQRAAIVMGADKLRAELTELAASTKDIVAVIDKAGRDQVHSAAMVLRKRKTSITGSGKAARDDATKFSKAVIVVEKDLVDLIEPEEDRLLALRDGFDAIEGERKAAELAADIARIKKIEELIDQIASAPLRHMDSDSAKIGRAIEFYEALLVEEGTYAEFMAKAEATRTAVLATLENMRQKELAAERAVAAAAQAAAQAEADRKAEAERMAAERAELDHQRAEQAAAAKRLADAAADLQRQREKDAATARAAQREAERLAKVEADKVAADRAALAQQQAEFQHEQDEAKAAAAAADKARDDAAALYAEMGKHYDAALAEDAERTAARIAEKQAMVDEAVAAGHGQAADERAAGMPAGALGVDALLDAADADAEEMNDSEFVRKVADALGMTILGVVNRMSEIDFDAARTLAEAA
jgi:DNA repair exonuclease SbcCD ATPase subunit